MAEGSKAESIIVTGHDASVITVGYQSRGMVAERQGPGTRHQGHSCRSHTDTQISVLFSASSESKANQTDRVKVKCQYT